MSNAPSLTEAAKLAATSDTSPTEESMTEEVRKAAREGRDPTVVWFRRYGSDGRGGSAWSARQAEAVAPASRPAPAIQPTLSEQRPDRGVPRHPDPEASPAGSEPLPVAGDLPRARPLASGLKLAAIVILALLSLLATSSVVGPDRPALATTQKRVALVLGNSAYRHTRRLESPKNDAAHIGAVLRKHGFRVIEGFDLDKSALDMKVREFTAALRGAEVGLLFYAGLGLHVSGRDYLVPVDAQLSTVSALDVELVRLDLVRRAMEKDTPTRLLFLDAGRDNPLAINLARSMGARAAEIRRGLGVVESRAGTLISFSTEPGKVALDGKGRNSHYSRALAEQLAMSNGDLNAMLIAVRNDVMKKTDGKQVPWENSALTAPFHFNPAAEAPASTQEAHLRSLEARDAWSATKDTTSIAVLEAFIARFRETFYAELAQFRIDELRQGPMPLPPPPGDSAVPFTSQ